MGTVPESELNENIKHIRHTCTRYGAKRIAGKFGKQYLAKAPILAFGEFYC